MLAVFPGYNGPSWQTAGSLTSDRKQCIFISLPLTHTHTHTHTNRVAPCGSAATEPYGRLVKATAFTFKVFFLLLCPPFQSFLLFILSFFLISNLAHELVCILRSPISLSLNFLITFSHTFIHIPSTVQTPSFLRPVGVLLSPESLLCSFCPCFFFFFSFVKLFE